MFGCGRNASLPRCCRPGSDICRSPLLSCLMLRVMRATLRGPAGPLPQVHPDKWYPSVGTWTSREGCLGKLGWMSGGVLNAIIRAKGPCTLFCKTRGRNKLDDSPEPFLNENTHGAIAEPYYKKRESCWRELLGNQKRPSKYLYSVC